MGKLYDSVRRLARLRVAWRVIRENGLASRSLSTRNEIIEFDDQAETGLNRIQTQLRKHRFHFAPAHGVALRKKSEPAKKRPIVQSPIPNRIVQRAILDVAQDLPGIREIQDSRFNFGGVAELGVPKAIAEAFKISLEKPFYIRTDIKKFFDNVPRQQAIERITQFTNDSEFDVLLTAATHTELDNLTQLGRDSELFPLEEIGVAQGSCLSPLLCNLLLHELDLLLNDRGVRCVRYIDDFILFAPTQRSAFLAFDAGKRMLANLGLDLYDPRTEVKKAAHGRCDAGFMFLGCEISPNRVRPSRSSQLRLRNRVKERYKAAIHSSSTARQAMVERKTFAHTVIDASNIIRGWGNTYAFCTDDRLMSSLDETLDTDFRDFQGQIKRALNKLPPQDRRRLLGLYLLADCNKDPLIRNLMGNSGDHGSTVSE